MWLSVLRQLILRYPLFTLNSIVCCNFLLTLGTFPLQWVYRMPYFFTSLLGTGHQFIKDFLVLDIDSVICTSHCHSLNQHLPTWDNFSFNFRSICGECMYTLAYVCGVCIQYMFVYLWCVHVMSCMYSAYGYMYLVCMCVYTCRCGVSRYVHQQSPEGDAIFILSVSYPLKTRSLN